jgi:integrase
MATINERKDKDGNRIGWQVRIRKNGYPLQVKTFRTKADAQKWAQVTESEMVRGIWRDRSRSEATTLLSLLQKYRDEILPTKKSQQSVRSVINILSQDAISQHSLASLTPELIANYRDKRLNDISQKTGRSRSTQTVRHELSLLSRVINHAMKEWGIALPHGNPCLQIRMPSQAKSRERRLTEGEEEKLLTACRQSRNIWLCPVVIFAIETAMRAGEILETWEKDPSGKVDGNSKFIQVRKSDGLQWANIDIKKQTAHLLITKNGEGRTVPLSTRAVRILEKLPRSLDGRVFGCTYESIHQAFARACALANIENLHFHDLRHEATSRFFEKKLNPMQVAAITGHKTLQMLKRYTHLRAEDLAKMLG